jgi:hypothetical protein
MSSCTIVFQVFIPAKLAFQERLKNLSSFFAYFPIDTSGDTNLGPLAKKEEKHGGHEESRLLAVRPVLALC